MYANPTVPIPYGLSVFESHSRSFGIQRLKLALLNVGQWLKLKNFVYHKLLKMKGKIQANMR